ncbi:MAG: glycogen/starch synthase [Alphaproteobacteria bacterium]|nr:glycogen/starch synthase [Alphaproteobacteria bacterium]
MKVLIAAAECAPFAKVGGLADAVSGVARTLADVGVDPTVVIPFYSWIRWEHPVRQIGSMCGRQGDVAVWEADCGEGDFQVWMVDPGHLFDRPGSAYTDMSGAAWPDSDRQFWSFSEAVADLAEDRAGLGWRADVVHVNDWHTAPVSLIMKASGSAIPTVLSIHNHAFQGLFDKADLPYLKAHDFMPEDYELHDQFSFLRAGVLSADELTTVSHSYRCELLRTPEGFGLEDDFRRCVDRLVAIPNGIDTTRWNPATDPALKCGFSSRELSGKANNKVGLQARLGLSMDPLAPLIAVVSRLTFQKMSDRVPEIAAAHLIENCSSQFVVLGRGDREIEERLKAFAAGHDKNFVYLDDYRETEARRLLAGADMLLHPSRFEPCGLVPIYAMRYGSVPIVTPTGGLNDLLGSEDVRSGFMASSLDENAIVQTLSSAVRSFQQDPNWPDVVQAAMSVLRDWGDAAPEYLAAYRRALGQSPDEVCASETVNLS